MPKKTGLLSWLKRIVLFCLILGIIWVVNLIWFKPFNIRHFYERVFINFALDNPEIITQLGVPVLYDLTKDELTDVSDEALREQMKVYEDSYETLSSYDYESLPKEEQLNYDILKWYIEQEIKRKEFFYNDYPVNQMFGVQAELPEILTDYHRLESKDDLDAYISRLSKFNTKFNQVIEGLKIREEQGVIPPNYIIDKIIGQLDSFLGRDSLAIEKEASIDAVRGNVLYSIAKEKLSSIEDLNDSEKEEYLQKIEDAVRNDAFSAYSQLKDYFVQLKTKSDSSAGVWKFDNGEEYYKYLVGFHTTTSLSPEEIHSIGLKEVKRIASEMRAILNQEGYQDTTKTLGEIILELNNEERFLYPDSDEGRNQIIADYTAIIEHIEQNLGDAFNTRPKADLEVKRIKEYREDGQALAYYGRPAVDGSRGGVFYINLAEVENIPKYGMKTLAYHEGIPGHHFQIAIQTELEGLPTFRNVIPFTAYTEGWALYTELLAYELGFYENDPFGNLGRLQGDIFRAVRLVVDTGIHSKRWTREQAINYMVNYTGMPISDVTAEIERYIVLPGQACAYKIGMMKILELREKAKAELGSAFDLGEFHDVVLTNGAVPLAILERLVNNYIEDKKGLN
ncbi:DUF885 domain-containing protein [Fulvivirga lutea]|uniref:DUF885 domain-containing protein n=1 Tax=Fulvivirga lutea TaxID=2810512 RepID=A0A974WDB8_9BACT|nr:DUF885 domain-containing protein [Fulvivirga lutea]QSE95863.1 DUF885 domain-containing protein [Fulvivirga lutea]